MSSYPLRVIFPSLYYLVLLASGWDPVSPLQAQSSTAYAYYYVDSRAVYRYSLDLAVRLLLADTVVKDSTLLKVEEYLVAKPVLCIAHDRMAYFYDSSHYFFYFIPQIAKMDTEFVRILIADRGVELWDYLRDSVHYHILFGYKNEELHHNANYAVVHMREGRIRKLLLFYEDKTIECLHLRSIYRNAYGTDTSQE